MAWFGADPGGVNNFGLAMLHGDGHFETRCCSSVEDAVGWIKGPEAVGIDCPLWWSSAAGGGRSVDMWLRQTYGISSGTVQSVNSLRGAVVIQGVLLAMRLRIQSPNLPITEAHPKALLKALRLHRAPWASIAERFELKGADPGRRSEHERDALLSAVAAREGTKQVWRDLSSQCSTSELDPKHLWFGPVSYWWPDTTNVQIVPKARGIG
jgi:predicted nuclease with RNAse H fold